MPTSYRAFISYSHRDERWARWLQSSLERFRPPSTNRADKDGSGEPDRLFPIFRDRDELPSSANLSASIVQALEVSEALIVICSPAATGSHWVNEEIKAFRALGRAEQIHCLVVDGSPDRDAPDCAFPPALLEDQGEPLPDPLAADVRPDQDGKRGAMLKIAAGLLGVGFDDLRQRDVQRQLRRRGFWTAGATAVALLTLGLAVYAQLARNEAELRRGQAENLIGFMLGELRGQLQPLGRLDVLDSVGDEAMAYFEVLGDRGSQQEVFARVMALRQIGEVRFRQGRLEPAQRTFEESRDLAESLLRSAPDDAEYLFEAGQAEFWVGYAAFEQADLDQAADSFERYMGYSRRLYEREPDNPTYRAELSYALSNLGSLSFERRDAEAALGYFLQSAEMSELLVAADPGDTGLRIDLGNGYSWIGAAHLQLGQLEESQAAYEQAVETLAGVHGETASPIHAEYLAQNQYHLGNLHAHQGQDTLAEARFRDARELLDALVEHDPDNARWRVDRAISAYYQGEWSRAKGDPAAAREALEQAGIDLRGLLDADPTDIRSAQFLVLTERSRGLLEDAPDRLSDAWIRALALVGEGSEIRPRVALAAARAGESHGRQLLASDDPVAAREVWSQALALLDHAYDSGLLGQAVRSGLLHELGRTDEAMRLQEGLARAGFRDPRYVPAGLIGEQRPGTTSMR